ncbi:protein vein isoform X2 [Solenopsis invicta]|uniref:protein vein isoform X2 n=1 Tax=Solenopsis invicta TaxID=13686 RepID=UPI00193D6F2E|nr:protein vein isoform X2 [Solenopsis invicta]XP_039312182.1 protein vein isoform X2 [Solenopsis invicta]XP_039312183.1 protein vein isoform X2 [Solenopsis invicta]
MMWAPLLLAGFLSGWWGALALAAAPPAIRDTLGKTSGATTGITEARYYRPLSISVRVDEEVKVGQVTGHRSQEILGYPEHSSSKVRPARRDLDEVSPVDWSLVNLREDAFRNGERSTRNDVRQISYYFATRGATSPEVGPGAQRSSGSAPNPERSEADLANDVLSAVETPSETRVRAFHPEVNESDLTRAPRHSSTHAPLAYPPTESSMQRPRVARSAKQRPKNRTRADSPREQRRRCRNKDRGCRGQNWCPDVDVGNRAYLAPTVFEGKARSMSSRRKPGLNYAVTFEVKQVYKSQPGFQPLQKNDSVRLHFRDKLVPGKSTVCNGHDAGNKQQQQQRDNPSGVVRANIKRGKVYLVFVNRVGPRNFTILGEPVIRNKKNEQVVQAVVRPDYVREVTLSELRDSIARLREKVKLVCRTRGSPPPRVHWLKDGVPLHPRRGLRIQHKRRRSKVVISSAKPEDSGRYECVAESTSGHRASLAAKLLVDHDTRIPETTTAAWPRQEQPCPIAGDFCMNGGTCLFFETVGEPACKCAEGFTGLRCETKDVSSTGNMDKFSSFAEDVTLARF